MHFPVLCTLFICGCKLLKPGGIDKVKKCVIGEWIATLQTGLGYSGSIQNQLFVFSVITNRLILLLEKKTFYILHVQKKKMCLHNCKSNDIYHISSHKRPINNKTSQFYMDNSPSQLDLAHRTAIGNCLKQFTFLHTDIHLPNFSHSSYVTRNFYFLFLQSHVITSFTRHCLATTQL